MRRTKIICTIGPASSSRSMLARMIRAGMDVARLNFSHGTHESHAAVIQRLRDAAAHSPRPLAILQDLSGPKVRVGDLPGGSVTLRRGQCVRFVPEARGEPDSIPLPAPPLLEALSPGDRLLADDGRLELRVTERAGDSVLARVVVGGPLASRKGITAPGVEFPIAAVTAKDLEDLRFGLAQGVDWVAASYVRGPEDILPLRRVMEEVGVRRPIIAKIEKQEAIRRIDSILGAVEGIMVARGDLGVEIPVDQVPLVQKRIIALCSRAGRPVITATQMLESMIQNSRPTRAEVTDVANAILDGTDAVMLSGETAVGQHPLEAVRMMARVASNVDPCLPDRPAFAARQAASPSVTEAVAQATVEMARVLRAAAILCATTSGSTARLIAKYRPDTPVVAVTPFEETWRQLALTWGVRPLLIPPVRTTDEMMDATIAAAVTRGIARPGDRVILTAGVPVNVAGNTNLIKVHQVGLDEGARGG